MRPRAPQKSRLRLDIHAASGVRWVAFLKSKLIEAHAILSPPLAELSLALVSARDIARLHGQFMNDPTPTDVLTFELDHDARGRVTSGEVVVCAAVAARRARLHGNPVENELLLYALHGMLHLCGYDDRAAGAFKIMHAKEDQILTRLGVGPTFSPSSRSGKGAR